MFPQSIEIPTPKPQNSTPYWQSIKIWINNISFQIEDFRFLQFLDDTHYRHDGPLPQFFHVAGQRMTTFREFQQHQEGMIWCTYRRNVRITDSIHSDIGWGCLLRVVQMAIANSLLKFSQRLATINRAQIIKAFAQERQAHYSIINLVEVGREEWGKKAGEWYGMSQVASILETLQERSPMPGSQNIAVRVYNQIVSIDELMPMLQNQDKEGKDLSQEQIPKEETLQVDQKVQKQNKKSILLMITTQFDSENRAKQQQHLLDLMELESFSSCLGGVPDKARFITGKYQNHLFYLDPHLVQESVFLQSLEQSIDTFTCKKVRSMKCSNLEPSLTLCFNLNTQQDILQLVAAIDSIQESNPSQQFLSYTWTKRPIDLNLTRTESIDLDFEVLQPSDQLSQQIQYLTFQQLTA